jgi:hypothetical protein
MQMRDEASMAKAELEAAMAATEEGERAHAREREEAGEREKAMMAEREERERSREREREQRQGSRERERQERKEEAEEAREALYQQIATLIKELSLVKAELELEELEMASERWNKKDLEICLDASRAEARMMKNRAEDLERRMNEATKVASAASLANTELKRELTTLLASFRALEVSSESEMRGREREMQQEREAWAGEREAARVESEARALARERERRGREGERAREREAIMQMRDEASMAKAELEAAMAATEEGERAHAREREEGERAQNSLQAALVKEQAHILKSQHIVTI